MAKAILMRSHVDVRNVLLDRGIGHPVTKGQGTWLNEWCLCPKVLWKGELMSYMFV
jgi:hypothetical protein